MTNRAAPAQIAHTIASPVKRDVRPESPVAVRRNKDELDRSVAELSRAAEATGFADLGVLVELSTRQIERAGLERAAEADEDLGRAEAHLERVLAIDEHSPAASNQLALMHLARAKRLGRPELERAMGVCLWATRENPTFAPLRSTAGLVELELRDVPGAIRSFETAVRLDPSSFEDAERAYDRMMAERPEFANEIRLAKQRVHDIGALK